VNIFVEVYTNIHLDGRIAGEHFKGNIGLLWKQLSENLEFHTQKLFSNNETGYFLANNSQSSKFSSDILNH
jgi:hypothetical protein